MAQQTRSIKVTQMYVDENQNKKNKVVSDETESNHSKDHVELRKKNPDIMENKIDIASYRYCYC